MVENKKIVLFIVNVDSFFISHRLAIAEAAQKEGTRSIWLPILVLILISPY